MSDTEPRPIEILLVEDTPSDAELTSEALQRGKLANHLTILEDGVAAMAFLRRQGQYAGAPRPDLILLDLNLPLKSGHEVLDEVKADEDLKSIPVVVLTSSPADRDVQQAYQHKANCYITKPTTFREFLKAVGSVESFWFSVVTLPSHPANL